MKQAIRLLLLLVALYLGYYLLSQGLYYYAWYRGDYPQPKMISSLPFKEGQGIDWFLVHGASMSASCWKEVIQKNTEQKIVAISLGRHELGPKLADPAIGPVKDIIAFMKTNKIKKGIIGHSNAAIWLALAYKEQPQLFKGVKLYLIAPNLGSVKINLVENTLYRLLPDIHWAFLPIKSCKGSKDFKKCELDYLGARKYRINSIGYYLRSIEYFSGDAARNAVDNLLKRYAQIEFIIAGDDHVIDDQKLIDKLTKTGHAYKVIEGSHHDAIQYAAEIIRSKR